MNITQRIIELKKLIEDKKNDAIRKGKSFVGSKEETLERGQVVAKQFSEDIAEWRRELDALEAPIVSMVVTHDNRVILATQRCVFELRGDKMVLITFEREI